MVRRSSIALATVLLASSCRSGSATEESGAAPSASGAPSARVLPPPVPSAERDRALNPAGERPYSGPVGAVRGVVRAGGPPPEELTEVLAEIPKGKCADARAFYGKTFREGPGRELGDVLVAVTGYEGFVPPSNALRTVTARGCAYESRTIAMVFGQKLEVKNLGPEPFMPELVGSGQAVYTVAIPRGDPVPLFPTRVGHYELVDRTHPFAVADVFVLKYPTFAVTGIDGAYEIRGIPAGKEVTVSAHLPALRATVDRTVKLVAGETSVVDFTIPTGQRAGAPSAAAGSASP